MKCLKVILVSIAILLLGGITSHAQSSEEYVDSLVKVRDILLSRNAEGTSATDIKLMTIKGDDTSLYQTESELTILYLYHPDCYACAATIQYIKDDQALKSLLDSGRLTILAVDLTEDMISLTENMLPPLGWTLCFNYDGAVNNNFAYYIEEYPSIYILDKDKKVLLKNPSAADTIKFLEDYIRKEN